MKLYEITIFILLIILLATSQLISGTSFHVGRRNVKLLGDNCAIGPEGCDPGGGGPP